MHFLHPSPRTEAPFFSLPFYALFSMHAAGASGKSIAGCNGEYVGRALFPPLTSGEEKTFLLFVRKKEEERPLCRCHLTPFGTFGRRKLDGTAVHSCL